jgi:hypothetical protein
MLNFRMPRFLSNPFVVVASSIIALPPLPASTQTLPPAAQARAQHGTGSIRGPVMVKRLDSLDTVNAAQIGRHPPPHAPLTGVDPATFAARKAQAAKLRFNAPMISGKPAAPQIAPLTTSPPVAPKNPKLTPLASPVFTAQGEVACGDVTPADQAVAVGDTPAGVLQVINVCLNVFNKTGVKLAGYPKSLTSLVGLPATTPTTDPRAIYDWINHRYVITFIQFDPNFASPSSYWIAASQADDPTGVYCVYNLPVQSVLPSGGVFPLPDFPRLGQDQQALYLASNIFSDPRTYKWEEILVLPKAQIYACQGFGFTFFSNLTIGGVATDSTQPANNFSPFDIPRSEFLITSRNINFGGGECFTGCNGLIVWSIHSPLSSPAISGVQVASANNYSFPPGASQLGAANSIDTGDTRISGMAFAVGDSIYASLNTNGGGGEPAYYLYQVQPFLDAATGNVVSARILNEIFHGGGTNAFYYATQQPDPQGNVTTVFNFSNSTSFASLVYASRRAAQPIGTEPDPGIFAINGAAFYNQGRWGDYTAVAPAGLAPGGTPNMWFAGMFARSDGTWGTAIGKNGYTSITQP